ncbi:MAG: NADP-dependent oxidoreductase [Anaerolineae bacterium]|nr:NADP-dependent oxidoreductase [Anaerolineae bacterium]
MKAVIVRQWGGSDQAVVEEMEKPQPGPGEVLVHIKATSINPVDWKIREGYLQQFVSVPYLLGIDVAGDIVALGEGVTGWRVGDAVYGTKGLMGGAYAEYTTVPVGQIAAKPASLDYIQAGSVPHASLTAWYALFITGNMQAGQRVLIHAAAGGVGHFAAQFAKAKGAYVIGTASGRNEAFVRGLGVDEFVDYTKTPFENVVKDVDLVVDTIGGDTADRSLQVIRPGGTLACLVSMPAGMDVAAQRQVQVKFVQVGASTEVLAEIAALIDGGQVKPHIQQVFDFSAIHEALQMSQTNRAQGKLVVNIAH